MSLPAAKHFDLVLGIDIHLILTPVGPVPIPHPFIGMVFDVFDYLPVIGSTVYVNGLPAAKAGTMARAVPFHFPIGGPFAPPLPSHDGVMFMGSSRVSTEGEPATFGLLPVLTCQSFGLPAPSRKKPRRMLSPLLPTSLVLPIPVGAPVTIGGPPTISLLSLAGAAAARLALKGVGKGLKRLYKSPRFLRMTKPAAERLHARARRLMSKAGVSRASKKRDVVHHAICTLTGHPVDVATGKVITDAIDFSFPGRLPLAWERRWTSTSTYAGPLGHGWHHAFDMALWEEEDGVLVRLADGRHALFEAPTAWKPKSWNAQERLTLRRTTSGFVVTGLDRVEHHFSPPESDPPSETDEARPLRTPRRTAPAITWEDSLPGTGRPTCVLSRIQDANGNATHLKYRGSQLVELVDSGGQSTVLEHDAAGRIVRILAPHPDRANERVAIVAYAYDERGNLTEVTDARGAPFRYGWRGHLLISEADRTGVTFHFAWDGTTEDARCIRTWGVNGERSDLYARRLVYDLDAHETRVTDSRGATTLYCWNELGLVTREVDHAGAEQLTVWDENAWKLSHTDSLGNMTAFRYDARGNMVEETDPTGASRQFLYNEQGDLQGFVDPLGSMWSREQDERGNVLRSVDPTGAVMAYATDGRGDPLSITDALGRVTSLVWDERGNLARVVDPSGATTVLERDHWGRLVRRVDAEGGETRITWDLLGNMTSVVDAEGRESKYEYDATGNVVSATDTIGRLRGYAYGPLGVLTRVAEPSGAETRFAFDSEGALRGVTDADGRRWSFAQDKLGRVVEEQDFTGRTLGYEYDSEGRLLAITNARGEVTRIERDGVGRVVRRALVDGTSEALEYDAASRLVRAANPAATVEWTYDPVGRVLTESQNGETVSHRYDELGNRIERHSPRGRSLSFGYDEVDRLARVDHAEGRLIDFEYDRLGRERRRLMPSGIVSERRYSRTGELLEQTTRRAKATLLSRRYAYDRAGQLERVDDGRWGTTRLEHDVNGRLSAAMYPEGGLEKYLFDASGNNLATPQDPARPAAGFSAAPRKPTAVVRRTVHWAGWELVYDADGNLIEKALDGRRWMFKYDAAGRLGRVRTPAGEEVSFLYDALGRRIAKRVGTVETRFHWDGDVLLDESVGRKGEAGSSSREYLFEVDGFVPLAVLSAGEALVLECDQVGVPRAGIGRDGRVVWEADLGVWGKVLRSREGGDKALEVAVRHQGQYEDSETGLVYNRFRYYDPDLRAYTQTDPIGLAGGTAGLAYADGDPTRFVDPYGLSAGRCAAKGGRGRSGALNEVKRDLGIPRSQHPDSVGRVPLTDRNDKSILGADGKPIMTREYTYTRPDGSKVVVQDHSAGHRFGQGGVGDQGSHFNVRPPENTRTGSVPGITDHYSW